MQTIHGIQVTEVDWKYAGGGGVRGEDVSHMFHKKDLATKSSRGAEKAEPPGPGPTAQCRAYKNSQSAGQMDKG